MSEPTKDQLSQEIDRLKVVNSKLSDALGEMLRQAAAAGARADRAEDRAASAELLLRNRGVR